MNEQFLITVWKVGTSWRVTVCPPKGELLRNEEIFGSPVDAANRAGQMIDYYQTRQLRTALPAGRIGGEG